MPFSEEMRRQLYASKEDGEWSRVIRIPQVRSPGPHAATASLWSKAEHDRFLAALELYPQGPWKSIADHVGSKTVRQSIAHAQKYRQKIARWKRFGEDDGDRVERYSIPTDVRQGVRIHPPGAEGMEEEEDEEQFQTGLRVALALTDQIGDLQQDLGFSMPEFKANGTNCHNTDP